MVFDYVLQALWFDGVIYFNNGYAVARAERESGSLTSACAGPFCRLWTLHPRDVKGYTSCLMLLFVR